MRRLFLFALLGVSIVALLLSDIPFGLYLYQVERDRLITQLQRDAFILGGRAEDALEDSNPTALDTTRELAIAYREEGGARVVIVNTAGTAVVINDPTDSREGLNYGTRPEIAEALTGRVATGQRYSDTLQMELVYVAVPIYSGDSVVGAVRLTFNEQAIDEAVTRSLWGVYIVALITLLFAILLAFVLSRVLSRNLVHLGDIATRLSHGDLSARADEPDGPKEVKELAQNVNQMATRLETLVNEQKSFAADASHQLRTPLTALQLRIERLREGVSDDPKSAARFDEIDGELSRMRRLIDGLLALGRSSVEDVSRAPQDLGAIVPERVEHWRSLAEESGVRIEVECPESALVWAVPTAAEQIIDNYIDNALSVMPHGGELHIDVQVSGDETELSVTDTGEGISPEDAERAFDRFWRGGATHEGTGLGLAVVKQLALSSGARVSLTPHPEGGTTARVSFSHDSTQ
jgi:signal transduction histidine kinase